MLEDDWYNRETLIEQNLIQLKGPKIPQNWAKWSTILTFTCNYVVTSLHDVYLFV